MNSTFTVPKRLPTVLIVVLSSLLFAIAVLGFSACKTDDVTTPAEKEQIAELDKQKADLDPEMKAAEDQARAAGSQFVEALKTNDAAAQSAALADFESARAHWVDVVNRLQAVIAQQDQIVSAAQQRATQPLSAVGTLLGIPAPLVDLGVILGTPLIFDRSRNALLDDLKTKAKQGLLSAVISPLTAYFKAYGFAHSTNDPGKILDRAHVEAVKQGDNELAQKLLTVKTAIATGLPVAVDTSAAIRATGG
jgi:hypothetical protein